ncbi:uncharacterized protein LOC133891496 isoform X2 [Phragmites australis]|uniref:uncharacterized protein LOC133891496 isoform X2 n=1 Tax=Phragmites australis TaxID=29695 RepID=UPI002D767A10|nr:uncharacterized protein LOC133891496 isoform X2 [Phragmites australis]
MAIPPRITGGRRQRPLPLPLKKSFLAAVTAAAALSVVCILSFTDALSYLGFQPRDVDKRDGNRRYLYWGGRVDCPGKHCGSCAGLGHQESSLRCALEEALFLDRVLVMPSRMCLSSVHNTKGILHPSSAPSDQRWETSSCAMESLYDIDLVSRTVPVILDNPRSWYEIVSRSTKLGEDGVVHVQGVSRAELKENPHYSGALLINRTASPLAWFMECKDRTKRSSVMLPYTFLPTMATKKLRDAANKMKEIFGDYDAIHVRRGDLLKNRKDRFGVERSLHPHLDRDTRPEFIKRRIARWIRPGRTLFIASNERTTGFFSPLSDKYRLVYSSNFSSILEPIIENNYQLFMVERLIMQGARTFVKTMKEFDNDRALCDDPKKNTKVWQEPVYTDD